MLHYSTKSTSTDFILRYDVHIWWNTDVDTSMLKNGHEFVHIFFSNFPVENLFQLVMLHLTQSDYLPCFQTSLNHIFPFPNTLELTH